MIGQDRHSSAERIARSGAIGSGDRSGGLSEETAHKVLTCGLAAAYVPQRGQSMKPRKETRTDCTPIGLLLNLSSHRLCVSRARPDLGGDVTDEEHLRAQRQWRERNDPRPFLITG